MTQLLKLVFRSDRLDHRRTSCGIHKCCWTWIIVLWRCHIHLVLMVLVNLLPWSWLSQMLLLMICIFAAQLDIKPKLRVRRLYRFWFLRHKTFVQAIRVVSVCFIAHTLLLIRLLNNLKSALLRCDKNLFALLATLLGSKVRKNYDVVLWWCRYWQNYDLVAFIHAPSSVYKLLIVLRGVLLSQLVCYISFWKWVLFKGRSLRHCAEAIWSKRPSNTCRLSNH